MAQVFPTFQTQSFHAKRLDYGTVAGAIAAFGLVFLAIYLGGGFESFFDLKALLIVLGGTIGATLVNFPIDDFVRAIGGLQTAFFPDTKSELQRVRKVIDLAKRARADGSLSLEEEVYREPDMFLRKCIELIVDGADKEEIRQIMDIELSFSAERHRRGAALFQTMGSIAPAMGLIGTLIGLVQMLQNLEDPTQIGPAMAVALLTTFYGAVFANLVFLPVAGKLRTRSEEEFLVKEMTIEGIVGVSTGQNPRMIEARMLSFLAPELRASEFD